MGDGIVIPLRPEPNPSDEELTKFLEERIEEYSKEFKDLLEQYRETERETFHRNEPSQFAFGRLLKYLGTLEKDELYRLLAGAVFSAPDQMDY